jgi:hypothetical protein
VLCACVFDPKMPLGHDGETDRPLPLRKHEQTKRNHTAKFFIFQRLEIRCHQSSHLANGLLQYTRVNIV